MNMDKGGGGVPNPKFKATLVLSIPLKSLYCPN